MRITQLTNTFPYPAAPGSRPPIRGYGSTRSGNTPYAFGVKAVDKHSELYKACLDFESLFIRQMLEVMRKTIHREDDMLGGGMTQDVFEGMLYDQYAKKMAETAGFGLADTIYRQVSSK